MRVVDYSRYRMMYAGPADWRKLYLVGNTGGRA